MSTCNEIPVHNQLAIYKKWTHNKTTLLTNDKYIRNGLYIWNTMSSYNLEISF